jgi:hypothetical protein
MEEEKTKLIDCPSADAIERTPDEPEVYKRR